MQSTSTIYILFIQLCLVCICHGFGLIASAGAGIGSVIFGTFCHFKECCSQYSIPADFHGLERDFAEHIFGQHFVEEIVLNALRSHWSGSEEPKKALTLSFHGWSGSGKNYVTSFIVKNLYKKGSKSKFVHHFTGRIHFPLEDEVGQYQEDLKKWIKGNVTACPRQLFVFDEVEKMPPKVLDAIKPMIDYSEDVDRVDYRQCIFIFLSNTGAQPILDHYLHLWHTTGIRRDDMKITEFDNLLIMAAYNEEGGFQYSETIETSLIDHYIPFMPLDNRHVRLCIIDEFKKRDIGRPEEQHIKEAMEFIQWGPPDLKLFSKTGCKRISQKVGIIVAKYNLNRK